MTNSFFERHRSDLDAALAAIVGGGVAVQPPTGALDVGAEAAFEAHRGRPFALPDAVGAGRLGAECSPWGPALDITYPATTPQAWLDAAATVRPSWVAADPAGRVGLALEGLVRLERRAGELAHAVAHTTGQPIGMAHRRTGPRAFARARQAIADAYAARARVPAPSRAEPGGVERRWRSVPRGLALLVGTATSPLEAGLAGLFASLATGHPVLVKPHPAAVLPLAIVVATLRDVLAEAALPRDVVQLCVDTPEAPIAKAIALEPAVGVIDYAGGVDFARWLAGHARQARLHLETPGPNPVVLDGCDDLDTVAFDLASALVRHAGQTPTAPRLVFIPEDGIISRAGRHGFDAVADRLAAAIDALVGEPDAGATRLGAVRAPAVVAAVRAAQPLGRIVREARPVAVPAWPRARTLSPALIATTAGREPDWALPRLAPLAFLVATHDTAESIERAVHAVGRHGAVIARVHSTNDHVLEAAADAFAGAGVPVSCNVVELEADDAPTAELAATSHAGLRDPDFVAGRFRVVGVDRARGE